MEKKRQRLIHSPPPKSLLNEVSDDILLLILSKLTMKEAAATSVLSHRWHNLWLYSHGCLNFDSVSAAKVNIRPLSYQRKALDLLLKHFESERPLFISWVNNILNLHRAPSLDGFRVCYHLDKTNGDDIARWIQFAIEKRVSKLELDFSHLNGYSPSGYNCYWFPTELLDSSNTRPFTSLTSLRLSSVEVSDEVAAYFISNCHSLEHLSIKGSSLLTNLNATTALNLKYLEIRYCDSLKTVDISKTNIESVNFHGWWMTYSILRDLHLLSEVSLHGQWCRSSVGSGFYQFRQSQLQRLQLDMGHSFRKGKIHFLEVYPEFSNLTHLEVAVGASHNQNIFCLTALICVAPVLNSFTLKVVYAESPKFKYLHELPNCEWRKSEKRTHECLKVVEFYGCHGYNSDMDLVYYLTEISVVLDKVIISPKLHSFDNRPGIEEYIGDGARERATLLKENYVRPGIEFVIL